MVNKGELAIHGGAPARSGPFPSKWLGATLIGEEELNEIKDVIANQNPFRHYGLSTPTKTRQLEEEIKKMLGCKYALAVSSGTAALSCALAALEIGAGDEVIIPALGWFSNYSTVVYSGALPVFAGIDDTLNLDPADFAAKITPRTKAVIVIHYQGGAANMNEIVGIARMHGIKVIEDCAQAFGGVYLDKQLGTIGDIAIASFQYNKMITAGEGGLVYTDHELYFARAVRYHDLGMMREVFADQLENKLLAEQSEAFAGLQFRMSELQSAFLLAQLRKLPLMLKKCRSYHRFLSNALGSSAMFSLRPTVHGDCGITLFMRFASSAQAALFADALQAEGIPLGSSSGCINLLAHTLIRNGKLATSPRGTDTGGNGSGDRDDPACRQTTDLIDLHIAIGIGPMFTEDDIRDIITAIRKVEKYLALNEWG